MNDKIKETVKRLLKAVEENTSSKWDAELEYTVECVILEECEICEDPDEPDVKYTGIASILDELEKLVNNERED